MRWLILSVLAMVACGASPVATPTVAHAATTAVAPPVARAIPEWIAPGLRGTLLLIDDAGWPKRWEGGPFHHCFRVDAERAAFAAAAAQRLTDLSGIPRTEDGPCNVEWVSHTEIGHTYAQLAGTSRSVVTATVHIHAHIDVPASLTEVMHEAGHVLGLGHSPPERRDDLMNVTPRVDDFSREEQAILAWIYGR